jgi:integrase
MSISLFLNSIQSEETKKLYDWALRQYGHDRLELGNPNPKQIEKDIIDFIIKEKGEGKSYSAISNYLNALKAYYQINDIVLNIRKIGKFMPPQRRIKNDRAYTHLEISKLLEVAELRMRVVVMMLASSGIRLGAIPLLKLRNIDNNKVTVYENDKEEYFTFITPECKKAIDSYLDMRLRYGEKLNDNSPLIREEFNLRDQTAIRKARHITKKALAFQLDILEKKCGIRTPEVVLSHGFRKFFTTQLVKSKINPEIREMLLGHKIGLASCYYRPTEDEMYTEYEKTIDSLTINEENRLRKKVEILTVEKSRLDRIEQKMRRLEGIYKK